MFMFLFFCFFLYSLLGVTHFSATFICAMPIKYHLISIIIQVLYKCLIYLHFKQGSLC